MPIPETDPSTLSSARAAQSLRGLYYALRTGAAAAIATAFWQALDLQIGLWIAISAVVVLQPDRHATRDKSLNRVIGTVIGSATATAGAALMPLNPGTIALVVAVTVLLGWAIPRLREQLPLAAITAVLVFTLDYRNHSLTQGLWRTAEIVGGVIIGLGLAYIPLPGEPSRPSAPAPANQTPPLAR